MTDYRPAGELTTRSYADMLKDIWWRVCVKDGRKVDQFDRSGKVIGSTSQDIEAGWTAANNLILRDLLNKVLDGQAAINKRLDAMNVPPAS